MSSAGREAVALEASRFRVAPCALPLVIAGVHANRHERAAAGSEQSVRRRTTTRHRWRAGTFSVCDTDTTDTPNAANFCGQTFHRPGAYTPPDKAYSGKWVAKLAGASRTATSGRQRAMGVLRANTSPGFEGCTPAPSTSPREPLRQRPGPSGRDRHHAVDNERTSTSGQPGIGARSHRSRPPCTPLWGANDQVSKVIGREVRPQRGCWNWLPSSRSSATDAAATSDYGSRPKVMRRTGRHRYPRGVDDVKWGLNTTDSRQLNSINYYLDDATIAVRARTRLRPPEPGRACVHRFQTSS